MNKQQEISKEQNFKLGKCKELRSLGIYSIAYDWANHKKQLGEAVASRFHNHKQYLRKHRLGKFAKHK